MTVCTHSDFIVLYSAAQLGNQASAPLPDNPLSRIIVGILLCVSFTYAVRYRQAHCLWLPVLSLCTVDCSSVPHCVCPLSAWLSVPSVHSLSNPRLVASALCMPQCVAAAAIGD